MSELDVDSNQDDVTANPLPFLAPKARSVKGASWYVGALLNRKSLRDIWQCSHRHWDKREAAECAQTMWQEIAATLEKENAQEGAEGEVEVEGEVEGEKESPQGESVEQKGELGEP